MRNTYLKPFLAMTAVGALLTIATFARAAISIGPTGAGPLTFDSQPTGTDFLSAYIGGNGASFTTTAQVDALIIPGLDSTDLDSTFVLATSGTLPPSAYAYSFRYNTSGHFLQSRPTTQSGTNTNPTAAGVLLMATLQNDTGASQSSLVVSYDTTTNSPAVGELPGHRVYFSVSGTAGSWQVIPAFSGIETNGRLSATLDLGAWPSGSPMYLIWFDDNANGVNDCDYTIDNLTFSFPAFTIPATPMLLSSPTNFAVAERQAAALEVSLPGSNPTYQWFRNGSPVSDLSFCTNGHNRRIVGATSSVFGFSSIEPVDAGDYLCVATSGALSVTSFTATVTVNADTVAPRILYASVGTNAGQYILHLSEPLNDACADTGAGGLVTQPSTWYIDEILPGGAESQLGVAGFLNAPSITGSLTLGLIANTPPSSPSNPIRITLVENLTDTSIAQNILPVSTSVYVNNFSNELVSLSHHWRYDDTDVDPGVGWFLPGFNAGAFPEGPGPFDAKRDAGGDAGMNCRNSITNANGAPLYGLGQVGTCIRLLSPLPPGTNNLITANFWTHFQFGGDPGAATLRWHGKMDDGAVIYLNGQELQRLRMPAAPAVITRSTLASSGVVDTDAEDAFEFISPPALRVGDNVLAVEIHQSATNSSDLTMAMQVSVITPPLPRLQLAYNGADVTITWSPDFGQLEYSDTLAPGSWSAVPGGFNGYTESATGTRYFRVRMP
jgi:hypothetical protein